MIYASLKRNTPVIIIFGPRTEGTKDELSLSLSHRLFLSVFVKIVYLYNFWKMFTLITAFISLIFVFIYITLSKTTSNSCTVYWSLFLLLPYWCIIKCTFTSRTEPDLPISKTSIAHVPRKNSARIKRPIFYKYIFIERLLRL